MSRCAHRTHDCSALLAGQNAADTPDAHVALAKTAAGDAYQNLFNFLCTVPAPRGGGGPAERGGGRRGGGRARRARRTDRPGMPSP